MKTVEKLVPKLRFPEFTDAWIFEKIGNISFNYDNKRRPISSEKRIKGMFPYYGANGIVDYIQDYIFDGTYILIAEDGVVDTSKYPIHLASGKFWANNHTHILKGKGVDDIYLFYALQAVKFMRYITGSAQSKLNGAALAKIEVVVPSFQEQLKIASFLKAIDERIALMERRVELLKKYKICMMQKIFTQQIRFKDENGQDYPDWQEKRLGDLIQIGSSKRVLQQDWQDEGVPFYRTREIINLANGHPFRTPIYISKGLYEDLRRKYGVPQAGDILVTGVGSIGTAYLVDNEKIFYFKDGNVLWLRRTKALDPKYLYQAFKTRYVQKQLLDDASITTVATYTIEGARKTKIKYPCLAEQVNIADFLFSIDNKIQIETKKLKEAQSFKKSLLQRMLV